MAVKNPTQVSAASLTGRSRGTATPAANGILTAFNIAHGLGSTPALVAVSPRNALSAALRFVTVDATNIAITYLVAPPTGSLSFAWSAEL
jgi:hypothetical protein